MLHGDSVANRDRFHLGFSFSFFFFSFAKIIIIYIYFFFKFNFENGMRTKVQNMMGSFGLEAT